MKKFFTILMGLISMPLLAAEEPVFFAEDFANQSVIRVQSSKNPPQQCQAVRILPKWYLTAAHCVYPLCKRDCVVEVQLLNGELKASALLKHNQGNPHVFVPPAYHPKESKSIRFDIALILFDIPEENYLYVDAKQKQQVEKEDFMKLLQKGAYADLRNQWEVLQSARPKLIGITNAVDRKVLFPIAVPDLRNGDIFFQQSAGADFYYFTQLRHYIGPNFGVERGMSGSGVIAPGGAIIGVVSSSLTSNRNIVTYNEKDEPVGSIPFSSNYFLFTPISQENASFINATLASHPKSSGNANISLNDTRYIQMVQTELQDVFAEFSSEKEILQSKSVAH